MPKIDLNDSYAFTACGGEFTFNLADYPAEALERVFTYGLGRVFQDRVNAEAFAYKKATGKEFTDSEKRGRVEKMMADYRDGILGRIRGESVAADPVEVEAMKLAEMDVLRAMGAKNRKEAFAHAKGPEYFDESKSGAISPNAKAFRDFIAKNDAAKEYTARARIIVDARKAADVTVSL